MGSLQDKQVIASWDGQMLTVFLASGFQRTSAFAECWCMSQFLRWSPNGYFYNSWSFSLKCLLNCIQLFCLLSPQLEFFNSREKAEF